MPKLTVADERRDLAPSAQHQALIFDWDGTTGDTQILNFETLSAALAEYELPMDYDWFAARTGVSTAEMVAMICEPEARTWNRWWCRHDLADFERLNLNDTFDVVVTRVDVQNGKPAPDIFLKCSEMLEAAPANCLVYEDSEEGIEAARSAGMDVIDVRPLRMQLLGY